MTQLGKQLILLKGNRTKLGSEMPAKVLVCIVTDGLENASHEYNLNSIKRLIKDCENDDWNFIYLAANQDAFLVGSSFGISWGNTYAYAATADGVANMSMTLNNATSSYRSMTSSGGDFKTKSKKLIDDPNKKEPENNSGSGTVTSNSNNFTVSN